MIEKSDIIRQTNVTISKVCITVIIVTLIWHYAFTSYLGNYDYEMNEGKIVTYSIASIELISKVMSLLAYISCFWLFIYKFWRKKKVNISELLYIALVITMLCVLVFFTKNFFVILFDLGEWSTRMGIISVIGCSIFFYAYEDYYWQYIKKLIFVIVLAMTVLITIIMFTQPEIYVHRVFAYKWLHGFGVIIRLGLWLFIASNQKKGILNLYVLIVDVLMMICLQTRLYFIDFALQLLFICVLMIKNRRNIKKEKAAREVKKICVVAIMVGLLTVIAVFLPKTSVSSVLPKKIQNSLEMFSSRIYDDTRTEQAEGFFEYFWDSFPFGVGYNTEGIPTGVGEDGIDCGYLNTMYLTGLPMVILLFLFTAIPIYRCWFRKLDIEQIMVVARATTWTMILLSSASTGFEIEFIYFIICAGRCAGWLSCRNAIQEEKL